MQSYTCPSCGAELVCDASTAATSCPYCGNPSIVPGRLSGAQKPDHIIPFRLSKADAVAALKKHYQKKPLLPKAFFRAEPYRADPGRLRPVLALQRQRRGRRHLQMHPVDDPPRGRLRRDRHAALPCPPRRLRHVRKDPRRCLEQNAGRKYGLHRAVRLSGPQAFSNAYLPGFRPINTT